jgi:predicted TIM-barrel fold metal-dependent hydrolase
MNINRRTILSGISSAAAAAALPAGISRSAPDKTRVRKIATEEAFMIPEMVEPLRDVLRRGGPNLDLKLLALIYGEASVDALAAGSMPNANRDSIARTLLPLLLDIDAGRLADMDANGVDMHLLSLGIPGVQMFERETAVALATISNDRLSEVVRRHPTRFGGLAAFAPQDPNAAAKEMERAINKLKLNGFLVNSHTNNAYLDAPQFWPILEAAQALDAPLYIHPRAPSDGMAAPFSDYRLEGSAWGYGAETGTHVMRLIFSGVLDRFPRLRIVIGHMGEALPFWMWRLDFMGAPGSRAGRKNQLKPSEYFRRNLAITTSGVEDPLALRFAIDKLGVDHVMWAIDYPYQATAPAVAFLEATTLTDEERAKVSYQNAERIFRIS